MKQFVFSVTDCTCRYTVFWKLHEITTLVLPLCIATHYGMEGPGIESEWGGDILSIRPDRPLGLLSLLYDRYWLIPGV
jgi:hypothetical protein